MEETLESQKIYQGRIISLQKDRVKLPDGKQAWREVVKHGGGAGIVAVTSQKEIWLVKQYRYPTGQDLWEIPAGKVDPGENPLQTAQRELREETGCQAAEWQLLSEFYSSPGFCSEKLSIYLAWDLEMHEACPDEGEFLQVKKFPLSEVLLMLRDGRIKDAKSIAGILLAAQFYI